MVQNPIPCQYQFFSKKSDPVSDSFLKIIKMPKIRSRINTKKYSQSVSDYFSKKCGEKMAKPLSHQFSIFKKIDRSVSDFIFLKNENSIRIGLLIAIKWRDFSDFPTVFCPKMLKNVIFFRWTKSYNGFFFHRLNGGIVVRNKNCVKIFL